MFLTRRLFKISRGIKDDNPRLIADKKIKIPWYLRELGFRKRSGADKRIIICVICSGLSVSLLGSGLAVLGFFYLEGYNAFQLIGPVVIGCGILIMLLSIEICIRRKRILRKIAGETAEEIKRHLDPTFINHSKQLHKPLGCFPITTLKPIAKSSNEPDCDEDDETLVIESTTVNINNAVPSTSGRQKESSIIPTVEEKHRIVEEFTFGSSVFGTNKTKVRIIPPTPVDLNKPAEAHIPPSEYIELILCPKLLKSKA